MKLSSHPYTQLTPERVLDAVESVGLVTDARMLVLNSYENRVYQVGIEDATPVILKFYRPNRWSQEAILEEHRFSQELVEAELSVVAPSNINGMTLHQEPESVLKTEDSVRFQFAIFPRQGGYPPELDQEETLLTLGRVLARWHNQGSQASFQHRPELSIEHYGRDSVDYLLNHNWIPDELKPAYTSLSSELLGIIQERWPTSLNTLRLHGDCHPGNILWRDEPHFVDLDDALTGPAVQDLWMLIPERGEQSARAWQSLLDGYSEFRDFDLSELHLVEPLRTLRLMRYSAWLARRWDDPAFKEAFPWFDSIRYWSDHILTLREQRAALDEAPPRIWL